MMSIEEKQFQINQKKIINVLKAADNTPFYHQLFKKIIYKYLMILLIQILKKSQLQPKKILKKTIWIL